MWESGFKWHCFEQPAWGLAVDELMARQMGIPGVMGNDPPCRQNGALGSTLLTSL